MTLMEALWACSGRSLCQAMIASTSVGKSVEIAPCEESLGGSRLVRLHRLRSLIKSSKSCLETLRHSPSLLFRLVNKVILNFNRNFAEPLFSPFRLLTVVLNLNF